MAFDGQGGARFRFNGPHEVCSRYKGVARVLVERTKAMYGIGAAGADAATNTTRLRDGTTIRVTVFRQAPPIITITAGGQQGAEEKVRDLCPYGMSWQVEGAEPAEGEEKKDVVKLIGGRRKETMPLTRQAVWAVLGPPKWKGPHVVDFWGTEEWKQEGSDYRQTLTRMRRNQACKSQVVGEWLDPADPNSTGRPALYVKGGQWNGVSCAPARPYADPAELPGGTFPDDPVEPLPRDFWLIKHNGTTYAVVHSLPLAGSQSTGTFDLTLDVYPFWPGFRAPSVQEVDAGTKPQPISSLTVTLDISESNFGIYLMSLLDLSSDGMKFMVMGTGRSSAAECPGLAGRASFGGTVRYIGEVRLTASLAGVQQKLTLTAETETVVVNRFSGSNDDIAFDGKDAFMRVFTGLADYEAQKTLFIAAGGDSALFDHALGSASVPYNGTGPTVTQTFSGVVANAWPDTGWYEAGIDYSTISGGSSERVSATYVSTVISAFYDSSDVIQLTRIDRADVTKTTFSQTASGSGAFPIIVVVRQGLEEEYPDTPYDEGTELTQGTVTFDYSATSTHEAYAACILRHGSTRIVVDDSSPVATTSTSMSTSASVTLRDGAYVQWHTKPSSGTGGFEGEGADDTQTASAGGGSHSVSANLGSIIPADYLTSVTVSPFTRSSSISVFFGFNLNAIDASGAPLAVANATFVNYPPHVNPYMHVEPGSDAGLFSLSKHSIAYPGEISDGSGTSSVQYAGEHSTCCATVGGDPKILTIETYRRVGTTTNTLLSVGPFITHKGIVNEVVDIDTKEDDYLGAAGSDKTPSEPRRHPADVPTCSSVHPRADIVAVGFRGPVSFGGMWPYNWAMHEDAAETILDEDVPGRGLGRVVTLTTLDGAEATDIVLVPGWEPPYRNEESP